MDLLFTLGKIIIIFIVVFVNYKYIKYIIYEDNNNKILITLGMYVVFLAIIQKVYCMLL